MRWCAGAEASSLWVSIWSLEQRWPYFSTHSQRNEVQGKWCMCVYAFVSGQLGRRIRQAAGLLCPFCLCKLELDQMWIVSKKWYFCSPISWISNTNQNTEISKKKHVWPTSYHQALKFILPAFRFRMFREMTSGRSRGNCKLEAPV